MTLNEYQDEARKTAVFKTDQDQFICCILGLNGEAGEVAEKVKKVIRDYEGKFSDQAKVEIANELGDILWYIAMAADMLGFTLEQIAKRNNRKLSDRKNRGKINGKGDKR